MGVKTVEDMVAVVKRNLEKHGFPGNSVALPLERLYEAAHRDGVNFNKVLDLLASEGIANEKTAEKIIFRPQTPPPSSSPFAGLNFDGLKDLDFSKMNMSDMMKQAQEMMKNLSPSQKLELKKMYDNMSPEERSKIMETVKGAAKS